MSQRRYTRQNGLPFGCWGRACREWRSAIPREVSLAPWLPAASRSSQCLVTNAFVFMEVFDIPTQNLEDVLTLHQGYCSRRHCNPFLRNSLRCLGHFALRLLDCSVGRPLVCRWIQCSLLIFNQLQDVVTLPVGCSMSLHVGLAKSPEIRLLWAHW